MSFVHLHCHTEYSLLESPVRLPDLFAKAKSASMDTVAMTDNGSMYGGYALFGGQKSWVEIYYYCEMYITPILGSKKVLIMTG